MGNTVYIDPQSGEQFEINPKDVSKVVFNPLKPQYFGPMAEKGDFIPGFYKLSVLPLIPSLTKDTNLQKLNAQMERQSLGIVVFASGNKVGTKLNENGVIQSLYNDKGEFAFNEINLMTEQSTYNKYWGIQVDMGSKSKTKVISGTQMAKQVINGLFSKGEAKAMRFITPEGKLTEKSSEETDRRVKEYLEVNSKRIQLGLKVLVKDLGLRKEEGEYVVDNGQEFISKLQQEASSLCSNFLINSAMASRLLLAFSSIASNLAESSSTDSFDTVFSGSVTLNFSASTLASLSFSISAFNCSINLPTDSHKTLFCSAKSSFTLVSSILFLISFLCATI